MKVAVLSDIHGNLPALEAVLADVDAAGADAIVLNGDLAGGPMPAETVDRLAALGDRAIWVGGNGDRWLVEAFDGTYQPTGGSTDEQIRWAAGQLSRRHRDRLAGLPLTVSLEVDGLGPVGFCHATARDDNEMILVDSDIDHYRAAFANLPEPVVVVGHSHMPYDRLADRRRIVKPGLGQDAVRAHRRRLGTARAGRGAPPHRLPRRGRRGPAGDQHHARDREVHRAERPGHPERRRGAGRLRRHRPAATGQVVTLLRAWTVGRDPQRGRLCTHESQDHRPLAGARAHLTGIEGSG